MERRNLLAVFAVFALSLFVLGGTAAAHTTRHKRVKQSSPAGLPGDTSAPETCVIHTLPSEFMDQGEFGTASSIADVVEVECEPVYAEKWVRISANELYSRCADKLYWTTPTNPFHFSSSGPSFSVELDNAGNATAVLLGGPSCAAGESLVSAHLEAPPYTTVTTGFMVLPPRETEPKVVATPETKVEGEEYSDVATIVQVEFPPVFAEEPVNINASQLYARCKEDYRLDWVVMGSSGPKVLATHAEEATVWLDNDGNAFVVLFGNYSCAAGSSLIEASLENAPYTTMTTEFTVEPPQPTFPH